jgi:hypothetical protein
MEMGWHRKVLALFVSGGLLAPECSAQTTCAMAGPPTVVRATGLAI